MGRVRGFTDITGTAGITADADTMAGADTDIMGGGTAAEISEERTGAVEATIVEMAAIAAVNFTGAGSGAEAADSMAAGSFMEAVDFAAAAMAAWDSTVAAVDATKS